MPALLAILLHFEPPTFPQREIIRSAEKMFLHSFLWLHLDLFASRANIDRSDAEAELHADGFLRSRVNKGYLKRAKTVELVRFAVSFIFLLFPIDAVSRHWHSLCARVCGSDEDVLW